MIIGVIGYKYSGKDSAADILAEKYGFKKLVYSDLLAEELKKRGMEITKNNMSLMGDMLREESGSEHVLANMLLKKIEPGKDHVISGFRSPSEVDIFRNEFHAEFHLVYIEADEQMRFKRKPDYEKAMTIEEFRWRDENDIKNKGLGKAIEMADIKMKNEGSMDELKKKVQMLIEGLK